MYKDMSIYNTTFDSANTAVRAFLTKVGEYYLGRSFNTSSGQAKKDWLIIKNEVLIVSVHIVDSKQMHYKWSI